MAQAQLDIILNAQKYQRDLVKTLGLTEKQAAAQALKMAREGKKAADAAAKAQAAAAKKSGDAWSTAFGAIGAAALLAFGTRAAGAIKEFTLAVIDNRNELTDAAARTGLYSDTLQALRLSAESSGQEFSGLLKATERIPKLMGDAARGTKTVVDAFEALGVATHDEAGNLRESDAVTRDLIKSLGSIESSTEKAVKGMALFGRAGGNVTQALGAGAKLFEQYDKVAKRFGIETGPEATATASRMQEEFARMGLVARGAGDDIFNAFGGDDGALGGVRAMTSAMILLKEITITGTDVIKRNFGSMGGFLTATIKGPIGAYQDWAEVLGKSKIAVQEYLNVADETDRIASAGSAAMDAFNTEIERNASSSKRAIDPQKELQTELATIAGISAAATRDLRTETQLLTDAYNEQTEPLLQIIEANQGVGEAAEKAMFALRDADERLTRDKDALREESHQKYMEMLAAERAAAERAAEEEAQLARDVSQARISNAAMAASAIGDIATLTAGKNKEAQRRAWRVNQAAAVSGALLNTALAVSNAFADVPFPANFAAAALAGIAGAAQAASVAASPAPSFYEGTGSSPYASPSGSMITAQLHPREVFKVENQSEAQRGPGPTFVETWVNGRSIATTVASEIRRGGEIAAEITRRTGRLGHSPAYRSA